MNIIASNRPFKGSVASNPKELEDYLSNNKVNRIYFPFWSWKVPKHILEKCECIGFHSAPLPNGKGGSPIQNMIRLGYQTTELCMFHMTKNYDEGMVVCRREVWLKGSLEDIITRISEDIESMINNYENDCIISYTGITDYAKVPLKFYRITDNKLPETDTIEQLYDEIRMRDEEGHPKAYKWHGKYKVDFTNAELNNNEVTASVRIFQG